MADITINGETHKTEDNSEIAEVCEDNGIPFSCYEGHCGTCEITIVGGMENLNDPTESEESFGLDDGTRLACQCSIKSGSVTIEG